MLRSKDWKAFHLIYGVSLGFASGYIVSSVIPFSSNFNGQLIGQVAVGLVSAIAIGVVGVKFYENKWTLLVFHALTTGACLSFGIFNIWVYAAPYAFSSREGYFFAWIGMFLGFSIISFLIQYLVYKDANLEQDLSQMFAPAAANALIVQQQQQAVVYNQPAQGQPGAGPYMYQQQPAPGAQPV